MAALKILTVATLAVAAHGVELTKSSFNTEVKESGKNAFVSEIQTACHASTSRVLSRALLAPLRSQKLTALCPPCLLVNAPAAIRCERRLSSSPLGEATVNP
jgi:hypothetical protein